jgi:transposase-like protein
MHKSRRVRYLLDEIVKVVEHKKIFERNKRSVETKILGVLLYHRGLSYRDTGKILGVIEPASYEAVHYWYKQFRELFAVGCKDRRAFALDETKVKLEGKQVYLWTAVDVDTKEVIMVYLSRTRCGLDTYSFLKKVLRFCLNKPLAIGDKATWYPWAIQRLGLKFKHETFGERNAVEQWYSPFKHRVKRFWKRFPFHSTNTSILGWCLSYVVLSKIWRCLF